jgi:hypothetical protein
MVDYEGVRFKQQHAGEFLNKKKTPIHIHRRMQAVYGGKCIVASTVRRWVRKFKKELGEASLCDQARSVRPVTATGRN